MQKMQSDKKNLLLVIGFIVCAFSIIVLPGSLSVLIAMFYIISSCLSIRIQRENSKTATIILILPLIISVTQNVYIGIGANKLSSMYVQILLSMHFLLYSIIVFRSFNCILKQSLAVFAVIVLLGVHSLFMLIVHPTSVISFISSIRNIFSCILIYAFSLIISGHIHKEKYYDWVIKLFWFVVVFGLFEWTFGVDVWKAIGITRLWELKGIPTNLWGIPPNWYSSEKIQGNLIRRMVSSFADPVNLGTFLYAAFMISWYKKKKVLSYLLMACALLTVSKGALLGFLIFMVINVWQTKKNKFLLPIIIVFTMLCGLAFVRFSMNSSTGSLFAHINGFTSSFAVLISNPLGLGVGNVGVLAGLFNDSLLNSSVVESGIGMITAQMGLIGIFAYLFFFSYLSKIPKKWKEPCERERVLYYSLLFSFIANAAFNEVALSPNSCGLYFIELGVLSSTVEIDRSTI